MHGGAKGFELGEEALSELLATDHGQAGNVVNRLGGVELGTLTAGVGKGLYQVGLHLLQAQLKSLE
jgi:hypothetical protein